MKIKMKIAIPTNDRIVINKRTGRSKEFAIFEIIDKKLLNTEYRENHHDDDHDDSSEHSHADVIALLYDVDLLIAGAVGKYMKKDLNENNINYELTVKTKIEDILFDYTE
jgi:predicted Fe-Mo cluster-binding NifX family protein